MHPVVRTKRTFKRTRRFFQLVRRSIGPQSTYYYSYSDGTNGEHFSGDYTPIELRLLEGRIKKRAGTDV
jgi:hypothetical protein